MTKKKRFVNRTATEADRTDLLIEKTKGHNKDECPCSECITLRMGKALDEIEERAKKEGKLPLSEWIVVIQESRF